MNILNKQELEIVQAFSSVDIPERIIRESNIKDLIHGMTAEQNSVQSDARRLERLRQEKKEGNVIGNWWNDRDDKVQDAQIDLNKSIGRLTQKSSQLLIVNTAISKVLSDQQRILLEQQNILKRQTDTLEEQNRKILEQQKLLEKQQQDINKANQGLMEAKGITQEQAQQLVGCVKLVKEAESRIEAANKDLKLNVGQSLQESVEQCLGHLNSGFTEQNQRHGTFEQHLKNLLSAQSLHTQAELERFAAESAQFKASLEQHLQDGFAEQDQRHGAFEQQLSNAFSAQSQHTQAELERFSAESTQLKSSIGKQMESIIVELGRRRTSFEQQLTSAFSTQSQNAQAELERFACDTTEFKANIGQQLEGHIQTVLEKASAQDITAQQLRETVKCLELKQETIQQKQTQALQAMRESLERNHQHLSADLSGKAEALKNAEMQLAAIQAEQQKSARSNRLVRTSVVGLALAYIGWQVAQHIWII